MCVCARSVLIGDLFVFYRKGGFFVDLFVRVSNQVAVNMYKQLGYSVYRTVIEYYSASNGEPDEDAYGRIYIAIYSDEALLNRVSQKSGSICN